jgi:3-dehydroquinate dehydratase I
MVLDFDSLVLAAATADPADEPAARPHADAVEFRLDLASDPLSTLDTYDGTLPIIATNRIEREGGGVPDGPDRLAVLREASTHAAVAAIDLELATLTEGPHTAEARALRDSAQVNGTSVIVSAHDFDRTPHKRLTGILDRASEHGDVAKLAVTAHGPGDVLALLRATHEVASRATVATMAMGEAGRHSRAVAPLYGSRVAYAPVDPGRATAPGQYDLATLAELIDRLR